jgi:hypothetical protein
MLWKAASLVWVPLDKYKDWRRCCTAVKMFTRTSLSLKARPLQVDHDLRWRRQWRSYKRNSFCQVPQVSSFKM